MPDEEKKTVDIDTSGPGAEIDLQEDKKENEIEVENETVENNTESNNCLLYTSPSPRDRTRSRMPSSA